MSGTLDTPSIRQGSTNRRTFSQLSKLRLHETVDGGQGGIALVAIAPHAIPVSLAPLAAGIRSRSSRRIQTHLLPLPRDPAALSAHLKRHRPHPCGQGWGRWRTGFSAVVFSGFACFMGIFAGGVQWTSRRIPQVLRCVFVESVWNPPLSVTLPPPIKVESRCLSKARSWRTGLGR